MSSENQQRPGCCDSMQPIPRHLGDWWDWTWDGKSDHWTETPTTCRLTQGLISSYSGVCWLVHVGWNLHRRVLHPTWFSSTSKQSFRAGTQGLKSQLGLKVKHCQWQFGVLDWPGACWSKLSKCAASLWCWMALMRHFCSESIALHSNVRRHAACGFHASAMNTLKDTKCPLEAFGAMKIR